MIYCVETPTLRSTYDGRKCEIHYLIINTYSFSQNLKVRKERVRKICCDVVHIATTKLQEFKPIINTI